MPSVLVTELQEYCQRAFCLETADECVEANRKTVAGASADRTSAGALRCRYFAPDAQTAGARLFSYAADWLPALVPTGNAGFLMVTCRYLMSILISPSINPRLNWLIGCVFPQSGGGFFRRRLRGSLLNAKLRWKIVSHSGWINCSNINCVNGCCVISASAWQRLFGNRACWPKGSCPMASLASWRCRVMPTTSRHW